MRGGARGLWGGIGVSRASVVSVCVCVWMSYVDVACGCCMCMCMRVCVGDGVEGGAVVFAM